MRCLSTAGAVGRLNPCMTAESSAGKQPAPPRTRARRDAGPGSHAERLALRLRQRHESVAAADPEHLPIARLLQHEGRRAAPGKGKGDLRSPLQPSAQLAGESSVCSCAIPLVSMQGTSSVGSWATAGAA